MYELHCPSCDHTQTLAFARLGAIAKCSSCHKHYKIKESNLTHQIQIKPAVPGEKDPLVPGLPPVMSYSHNIQAIKNTSSSAGHRPDQKKADSDREEIDKQHTESKNQATKTRPLVLQVQTASKLFHHIFQNAGFVRFPESLHARMSAVVAVSGAVAAIALVIGIYLATRPPGSYYSKALFVVSTNTTSGHAISIRNASDMTPIAAKLLKAAPWEVFKIPKRFDGEFHSIPGIQFKGNMLSRKGKDGTLYFSIIAVNHTGSMIEKAWVHLVIVKHGQRKVAQTRVPIAFLSKGNSTTLSLRLPEVASFQDRIIPAVTDIQYANSTFVTGHMASFAIDAQKTKCKILIEATNTTGSVVNNMSFLVTAKSNGQLPVYRWLITWDHSVQPGEKIHPSAVLNLPKNVTISRWDMHAVAQH